MTRQTRSQSYKVCFCFRRIFKLRVLEPPEDIKKLFQLYSQNGIMDVDGLRRFLVEIQGEEDATKEDAQNIFNRLKHLNIFQRKGFHLEAFFRYLLNDLNGPLSPSRGVHQDMTAPLAHYFMFTGHNSYLIGNQVNSDCSVEPIIKALQRGVRVIELDLWPNPEGDDVEVSHGGGRKTFTAPVDFLQCLEAIKEHAFVVSEYPVVITFEDHLNPFLQSKVAQMVNETFGEMLFLPESDHFEKFYSPKRLKKKILISTKPPKEYLDSKNNEVMETPKLEKASKKEQWKDEQTDSKSEPGFHDKEEKIGEEHLPGHDEETVSVYKQIIAIPSGKLKGDYINLLHDAKTVKRLSISEQELEIATKKYATEIVRFTQQNILRVYPKGLRVDSSNYNPFVGWMHGAQMVAFNMQGYGKQLWIMQGMFRANGGCGYVKKPDFLLHPISESFHCYRDLRVKTHLQVKVYMGEGWDLDFRRTHFDLYSPPDFFVKVAIAGVPADEDKCKTKVIEDDWLPEWNEEFKFKLAVPELAVLRIEAKEYDTTAKAGFAGQTCLPVSELRNGIRAVPLHNRKGEKYKNVKLLMEFRIY